MTAEISQTPQHLSSDGSSRGPNVGHLVPILEVFGRC